jgi:hypothetical protein
MNRNPPTMNRITAEETTNNSLTTVSSSSSKLSFRTKPISSPPSLLSIHLYRMGGDDYYSTSSPRTADIRRCGTDSDVDDETTSTSTGTSCHRHILKSSSVTTTHTSNDFERPKLVRRSGGFVTARPRLMQ